MRGAGAGPAGASVFFASGGLAQTANRYAQIPAEAARVMGDTVAALLQDLSAADVIKLLDALARSSPAQGAAPGVAAAAEVL
ncbi:MAG: hypothetical protein ACRD9L_23525, partial [Bryobacteraceae bacterium]